MEEHAIILKAINVLEVSASKELPKTFYDKLLDIFRNFADRCHHGKEESALFPLIKLKDGTQSGNISSLLDEHESGRRLIVAIREAVDKNDQVVKMDSANKYSQLLTGHIRKENELFVKWFGMLTDADKELLFEEFEQIEERVIGLGRHEEYAAVLKGMALQLA